ncbi:hypothetical protein ASPCADRAFT_1781 [Aspergillus carbonarius ITEM 5010]|uniref:Uncharacterized protein n=1 Tax=Aspergillus carbonarius (strain ITEM 5010) TaxID=602072 RepID=A0A1R3S037_ASPC5|nr:hypothetical protein ASPCADRAFT_1781 [Aspergillus carbonarius ITEM 5010]
MKLFNLFVLWCSVLFTHVLADNESVGYEIIYLYYVYKMQYDADVDKTIAVGCVSSEANHMCYFSEFAKYIMENDWRNVYKPSQGDRTTTPGDDQLKAIKANMPASASYVTSNVFPEVVTLESFPEIFTRAQHAANTALETGDVEQDTIKGALDNIKMVKQIRFRKLIPYELKAVEDVLTEAGADYIMSDANGVDYQKTLDALDSAEYDGEITDEQCETWKAALEDFSENLVDNLSTLAELPAHDQGHINILRATTTCINQTTEYYDSSSESSSGDSSLKAPSHCEEPDIEFGSGSGSE